MKSIFAFSLLSTVANAKFDQHVRRAPEQTVYGGESVEARPWYGVFNGNNIICGATLIHSDIAVGKVA
jgi:hypothetical protein